MGKRWIVSDHGNWKEYPTGRSVCKAYKCSAVSLYARLHCKNQSPKSPIFGRTINVYQIPGDFGDPYDTEKLERDELCDMCRAPISEKAVNCDECDKKLEQEREREAINEKYRNKEKEEK